MTVGVSVITASREYATHPAGTGMSVEGPGEACGRRWSMRTARAADDDHECSHAPDCIIPAWTRASSHVFARGSSVRRSSRSIPRASAPSLGALDTQDPPATAGRWGTLIGFDPGAGRRRLVQFDRRGHLIAAFRWRDDGALAWARCSHRPRESGSGSSPARARIPAGALSDRVWLLDASGPFIPARAGDGLPVARLRAARFRSRRSRIPGACRPAPARPSSTCWPGS